METLVEAQEIVNGAWNFPEKIKDILGDDSSNYSAIAKRVLLVYAANYAAPDWFVDNYNNEELMKCIELKVERKIKDRIAVENWNPVKTFSNVLPSKE